MLGRRWHSIFIVDHIRICKYNRSRNLYKHTDNKSGVFLTPLTKWIWKMNFLKYRIAATNVQNTQNTQNQHNTNKTKCENDSEITQKTEK